MLPLGKVSENLGDQAIHRENKTKIVTNMHHNTYTNSDEILIML